MNADKKFDLIILMHETQQYLTLNKNLQWCPYEYVSIIMSIDNMIEYFKQKNIEPLEDDHSQNHG